MSVGEQRPLVTAAIANYNGRELLEVLLPSLCGQTYERLEVVVVDDASSDDSCAYLAEHWPQVKVVALAEKVGVATALDLCSRVGCGELVLLLNNDIELDPDCIGELVSELCAHPDAAVVQAKLLDFTRRELLDGTGDSYSWAGVPHRRGQGELDRGQYDELREVFAACAAAALYRRSAFERVGGFDARFFALCEDVDWAFRARLAGLSCRFAPGARAYHIGSASLGARVSEFTLYHNWRNQIWVVAKNYPPSALVCHAPDLLMGALGSLYVALRHRCTGVWLRAWRDALRGLPAVLAQRKEIQRVRICGRSELEPVIESAVGKLRWWLAGEGRFTAPAAARKRQPDAPR